MIFIFLLNHHRHKPLSPWDTDCLRSLIQQQDKEVFLSDIGAGLKAKFPLPDYS